MNASDPYREAASSLSSGVSQANTLLPQLPPAPAPSADPGMSHNVSPPIDGQDTFLGEADIDVFTVPSATAMKMLYCMVESLVRITGDTPPTPPISLPATPIIAQSQDEEAPLYKNPDPRPRGHQSRAGSDATDSVPEKLKTPTGSPDAALSESLPTVGSSMKPLHVQHDVIAKKFDSMVPPPISLKEYLLRLHCFCPMSTAVYLATSLYIHKLAVIDKTLPVTAHNVHRLLLAGLRVAMKALEDRQYPHSRFAKVGGIIEPELRRLEISFCFITNFTLKVTKEMLSKHALIIRDSAFLHALPRGFQPKLPPLKDKCAISQDLPLREKTKESDAVA